MWCRSDGESWYYINMGTVDCRLIQKNLCTACLVISYVLAVTVDVPYYS